MIAEELPQDPYALFESWFAEAQAEEPHDANAMALATSGAGGPSVRMVLMKDVSPAGFTFYTNEISKKGEQLRESGNAALLFYWKSLRRQIRVEGPVRQVPEAESNAYFASRPRGSQIGAWASKQSSVLPERQTLTNRIADFESKFAGTDVPRPPTWYGWLVEPRSFEFWIDRRDRLHERYVYERTGDSWQTHMLYP